MTLEQRLDELAPRKVALVSAVVILVLGALGGLYAQAKDGGSLGWVRSLPIGLNGEGTVPAIWSAFLLVAAGVVGILAARRYGSGDRSWAPMAFLGGFLIFMGIDELLVVHEHLEGVFNVDWFILYAPVAAVGGIAWLLVVRRLWGQAAARWMLIGGAACWLVAQFIEVEQYESGKLVHRWTILPEEVLEMTGSLLFGLALLLAFQAARGTKTVTVPAKVQRSFA